ncbi:MAG: hypothetical protein PF447_14020, partial [Spirochaetaceae bacterium]|nr:hypothetical protein [Spirochaetaceae bacterium]
RPFLESLPPWEDEPWEFSLSNLGVQHIKPQYGKLEVKALFGPTFSAGNEKVIGVNSSNGEMYFTLISDVELMDRKSMERVKELGLDYLRDAVKD